MNIIYKLKAFNKGLPGKLLSLSFNYVPGSHSKIEKSGLELTLAY